MTMLLKILFALIDLVCFVGGSILFLYSLSQLYYFRAILGKEDDYYDYELSNSEYIAVAIGLIVLGIVIRSWRMDYKSVKNK